MKKLLPQANTLATVIRTFRLIANSTNCTLEEIAEFNQFKKRQAAYYSNACFFLGLIEEDFSLTPLGLDIMKDPKKVKVRIYELLIEHELVGRIFAKTALLPKRIANKECKQLVMSLYPDYGDAVIERRTNCLIGWCEEVIEYMRNSNKA